jgi:anti-sigma regulatory factor (Ser/Thr protein kinase)
VIADDPGVVRPHDHAVSFYRSDSEVVGEIVEFVAGALSAGECAVVVATAAHREAIGVALGRCGYEVSDERAARRYVALDAAETLARFMIDGRPDAARFEAVVGGVLDAATAGGKSVRVFGEMVALLWMAGNVAGAIELESMWNDLAAVRRFSLLCAYPTAALDSASLQDANDVCQSHSHVTGNAARTSGVLVATPLSVRTARQFAVGVVESWGEHQLAEDVALIVTELSANAVRHAVSDFRVTATRSGSRVRVAVDDGGPGCPKPVAAGPGDASGRGLALVARLADRWGWEESAPGKSVWAEFDSDAHVAATATES